MKFQVPQFIEVEDKIFGPLTLKQFIYIAGGGGVCVALFLFIPWWFVSIPIIIPIGAFSAALAFYKFNNKPFVFFIESAFTYLFSPRLYIWRKEQEQTETSDAQMENLNSTAFIPKLSNSKLKDLTWSLDTKESLNPVTEGDKPGIGK